MGGLLYLGSASLGRHPVRTALLALTIAVVVALPLVTESALDGYQASLRVRAEASPLIVGPRGGRFDLLLDALALRPGPAAMRRGALDQLTAGLDLTVLPLHQVHQAGGATIIGTDLDYLRHRHLGCAVGRLPLRLGECVLGATTARRLGLAPGATLTCAPLDVLDPSGGFSQDLLVTGVLTAGGQIDDERIFCDLHTAWLLDGIGHGHTRQDRLVTAGGSHQAAADTALRASVTAAGSKDFHFHGDPADFPLSAAILLPADADQALLVRGRAAAVDTELQIIVAEQVLDEVIGATLRFRQFGRWAAAAVLATTLALLALVAALAYRLRAAEFATLDALGITRGEKIALVACEWLLLGLLAALLAALLAVVGHGVVTSSLHRFVTTWEA